MFTCSQWGEKNSKLLKTFSWGFHEVQITAFKTLQK